MTVPGYRDEPAEAWDPSAPADPGEAEDFLRQCYTENQRLGPVEPRLAIVRAQIAATGTYVHTTDELAYGAKLAWRNASRCIGRLYWRSLVVLDRRRARTADEIFSLLVNHLQTAGDGQIRPVISVFAAAQPGQPYARVWNEQLIRYAGHADGSGDLRYRGFADAVRALGWQPPAPPGRFDLLPLVVETAHEGVRLFTVPPDVVHEVALEHPELPWFSQLGLRWHAVPVISNMRLTIGGVTYPAAPFNSWFVGSEIGARSLADENACGVARSVAEALGLDTSTERSLWRDRAVVELNRAVLHSFDRAAVTITDHHAESRHRLSWLRSRQRHSGNRPAFRLDPAAARRARTGGPARFSPAPAETTRPHSPGRLAELLRRRVGGFDD